VIHSEAGSTPEQVRGRLFGITHQAFNTALPTGHQAQRAAMPRHGYRMLIKDIQMRCARPRCLAGIATKAQRCALIKT
jgi:hypothetical protein